MTEDIQREIEKVKRRVPDWKRNESQFNSQILQAFIDLDKMKSVVHSFELEQACAHIKNFKGNFQQIHNFGIRNHAKVFEKNGDLVELWKPVEAFIRYIYN